MRVHEYFTKIELQEIYDKNELSHGDYWSSVISFIESVQYVEIFRLTEKQRLWIERIKEDLS